MPEPMDSWRSELVERMARWAAGTLCLVTGGHIWARIDDDWDVCIKCEKDNLRRARTALGEEG